MTRLPHPDSLDQHLPDEAAGPAASPASAEETYVMPASLEQSRYWTLAQIDHGSTASNMAISCEITGPLDPLLVEQAVAALTLRHEALRTLFRVVDGHLSQVIVTRPLYEFTQQDMARADGSDVPHAELADALSAHSHVHIDLEHGPVLRARLLRLAARRHVLAITMSHVVCDGWSNGILLRDFMKIYYALRTGAGSFEDVAAGRASGLPDLPFQFADFTVWQNEYLASERAGKALQFLTSHIPHDLPALDMPADYPRKPGRSFPGTIASALLPASLNEALVAWCRKTGSTKHIVLLACFEAICARFSGQRRFLLGSTIANRTQADMEDMVGRFANPQIIVADVEGNPTFRELESRVREWESSAYTHQDMPFSRIVEEFQMSQEGAGSQFLQVWFVYQKAFMQPQEVPGLRLQPLRSVSGGVDFDLLVSVVERAEGPRLQIEYNTELFSSERIEALLSAFQQMLTSVLADPDLPISQIALSSSSTAQVPPVPAAGAGPSIDLIATVAHHVEVQPDAIAIRAAGQQLSWRELQERSCALAMHLAQQSRLGSADRVLIVLTPQIESAIALLALFQLGENAPRITPLPAHTNVTNLPADVAAFFLLAPESLAREAGSLGIRSVSYKEISRLPSHSTALTAQSAPQFWMALRFADNRSDHENLVTEEFAVSETLQSVAALAAQLRLSPVDAVLSVPPTSPADALFDLLLSLYSGATLDLLPFRNDVALQALLDKNQTTVVIAGPTHWRTWVANGWSGDRRVAAIARGRHIAHSGWLPTEIPVRSRVAVLSASSGALATATETPEFKPLPSVQLSVLDSERNTTPAGATDVLYASGSRPTGFLAQSTSLGTFRILGSSDSVVHLHGHRVRLSELEHALLDMPGVLDAAAHLQQSEDGIEQVVAWIVGDSALEPVQIRNSLMAILPQHLIPATLQIASAFSFRVDGALDLSALDAQAAKTAPNPVGSGAVETASYMNDDVAREVNDIWKEVLNLNVVDPDLPFFQAGGNSLLLVRLFARLNKSFGTRLPITTIFEANTVASISERLRRHTDIRALVPVQTHGDRPPVFMIHSYLLYQALSQALGESQPFYGLRELETDSELDMQQRVANYVHEIRSVQPHGPYSVMGWCAAGPLTVEVARHLIEAGEAVESVILFDSWLPGYLSNVEGIKENGSHASRWHTIRAKLGRHRRKMQTLSTTQRAQYIRAAVMRSVLNRRNRFLIRHWSTFNTLATRFRLPLPQFMYNTTITTFAAMNAYRPQPVPIHLSLIRAHDRREILGASEACGWERVATQGIEVLWAPGDHETMFLGENLRVTTALIRRCLEGEMQELPARNRALYEAS